MNNYLKRAKNREKYDFFFQKSADMGISSEGNMGAWVYFPLPVRTPRHFSGQVPPPGITIAVHASLLNVKFLDFSLFYES